MHELRAVIPSVTCDYVDPSCEPYTMPVIQGIRNVLHLIEFVKHAVSEGISVVLLKEINVPKCTFMGNSIQNTVLYRRPLT